MVVTETTVSGDSLMGLVERPSYWERGKLKRGAEPGGIPLDEVQRIEVRRANVPASIGLVLGITMLLLLPVAAMSDMPGD